MSIHIHMYVYVCLCPITFQFWFFFGIKWLFDLVVNFEIEISYYIMSVTWEALAYILNCYLSNNIVEKGVCLFFGQMNTIKLELSTSIELLSLRRNDNLINLTFSFLQLKFLLNLKIGLLNLCLFICCKKYKLCLSKFY